MDESELIRHFFMRPGRSATGVVQGIGDDGAVTELPAGEQLVTVTDTLVAGTHFGSADPACSIGHRVLAVNLSDLAAMAARPRWFTLSLSLPSVDERWLAGFAEGLFALADRFGIVLVGGDTVRGPLAATVTAMGSVPESAAVTRSGARAGDLVCVTGDLGAAGFAWRAARRGQALSADDPLLERLYFPSPRVPEGLSLRGLATAMIDLSDGLDTDLRRLLEASGLGAQCNADAVPLAPGLCASAGEDAARRLGLFGGDDYELCFTLPEAALDQLAEVSAGWSCAWTQIGRTVAGSGLRWQCNGQPWSADGQSFEHFSEHADE